MHLISLDSSFLILNQLAKLLETASLSRFREKIRDHVVCWTVFNLNHALLNHIGDEKITNIQMS